LQEVVWDFNFLSFFTHIHPSAIPNQYTTKIVIKDLKIPIKFQEVPKFCMARIPARINFKNKPTTLFVYSIEVKTCDAKDMITILKETLTQVSMSHFR
jgi:hypothetical protein